MFRIVAAAVLLAGSASLALAATDEELRSQIVGSWGQDASCGTGRLTFNADGTFTLARPDRSQGGTWSIAGGMLSGTASDGSPRPDVGLSFEADTMIFKFGKQEDRFARCAS
ncbi:MAG: hypothetical protein KDK07_14005 [Bauldia sp.]|nr:hypothetical protein [Bauldia sp.]